ncbi:MAG: FtsX-like permease family protein [Chloracidobacterium sp.]|uniref:ABC transporter permease n=1 Tax=Chloracidobacterium validum TaxID=2821543 RepID=A0ABX8BGB0_9BACT|nr:FtsX-like permease family protein [Chloracidobacterium validum]QUW04694.1 ABC transporter permease [Chloracidobacterium validum]
MLFQLVWSNVRHRPVRTALSAFGVALAVILILVNAGLVNGSQRGRAQRETNVQAELMFWREFSLTSTSALVMPIQYADRLRQVTGVAATAPVGQYLKPSDYGIGVEIIEGIEWESYARLTGIKLTAGTPPVDEYDAVVDAEFIRTRRVKIGDTVQVFERPFRIAGVYAPEAGTARFKMRLDTMQNLLAAPERCTFVYVKCVNPSEQEAVAARIVDELPDNTVILVRDLPAAYEQGIPALNTFLKLVVGLAVAVGVTFVFLTMYTTIAERKRDIGILKSLGASPWWIIQAIEAEALLVGVMGLVLGVGLAYAVVAGITSFTALRPAIELRWLGLAAAISLASTALGALYPAWRAARLDPVETLAE